MGVAADSWGVVPGGWSIGVEFTFHAAFPLPACVLTTLPRAICLFLVALVIGATLNALLWPSLNATIGSVSADNFPYFWFPNQMSVFALGLCLFFLLERDGDRRSFLAAHPSLIRALSLVLVASAAFITLPRWLDPRQPLPPRFLLVSPGLVLFILALPRSRPGLVLNGPAALLGRVSSSGYLSHFAVLKIVSDQPFPQNPLHASGWPAIMALVAGLVRVVLVTPAESWCTQPGFRDAYDPCRQGADPPSSRVCCTECVLMECLITQVTGYPAHPPVFVRAAPRTGRTAQARFMRQADRRRAEKARGVNLLKTMNHSLMTQVSVS